MLRKEMTGTNQINNCAIILLFECVSRASITFIKLKLSLIISRAYDAKLVGNGIC